MFEFLVKTYSNIRQLETMSSSGLGFGMSSSGLGFGLGGCFYWYSLMLAAKVPKKIH